MHTVAREYALRIGLKLEKLMDSLPRTNDPGCSAGYAHGLVTAVAPEIEKAGPTVANRLCAKSETRYQRYSCTHGFGHAFMRLNQDKIEPSLVMCEQLGSGAAPDCAQGIYHDYWFSVNGLDDTVKPENPVTEPRELCGAQPEEFVRPCWYRAFVETAAGTRTESAAQFEELCGGLTGLQRHACVTGASVIGPPDPLNQLTVCASLDDPQDVEACIRGTKVQNLLNFDPQLQVDLIKACNPRSAARLRSRATAGWARRSASSATASSSDTGCPELPTPAARRACLAGVEEHGRPARHVLLSARQPGSKREPRPVSERRRHRDPPGPRRARHPGNAYVAASVLCALVRRPPMRRRGRAASRGRRPAFGTLVPRRRRLRGAERLAELRARFVAALPPVLRARRAPRSRADRTTDTQEPRASLKPYRRAGTAGTALQGPRIGAGRDRPTSCSGVGYPGCSPGRTRPDS